MIDHYVFGEIIINTKSFHTDVIVYPDKVKDSWWRKQGHYLQPVDIMPEIAEKPELFIIGTGYNGVMEVAPETEQRLKENNINYSIEKSREAVKHFNQALSQGVKVIAALHLTC